VFDALSVTDNPCWGRGKFKPINWSFIRLWLDGKSCAFVNVSSRAQLWTRATIVIVKHSMSRNLNYIFDSFLVSVLIFSHRRGRLIHRLRYVTIAVSFYVLCTYSRYFLFALLKRWRDFWISSILLCTFSSNVCFHFLAYFSSIMGVNFGLLVPHVSCVCVRASPRPHWSTFQLCK
jgi:hypothetical protein